MSLTLQLKEQLSLERDKLLARVAAIDVLVPRTAKELPKAVTPVRPKGARAKTTSIQSHGAKERMSEEQRAAVGERLRKGRAAAKAAKATPAWEEPGAPGATTAAVEG